MPRILNAQIVHGVGSTGVSVNNVLMVPQAGAPAWIGPDRFICNGPWPTAKTDILLVGVPSTKVVEPLIDDQDVGADLISAGAGTLAAGLRPASGAFTRLCNEVVNQTLNGFIPWDVDRTTGAAVLDVYQQGHNLHVWPRDNGTDQPTWTIPTGDLISVRCLWNRLVWSEVTRQGIRPAAFDFGMNKPIDVEARPGNCYQPLLISSNAGRLFILYSGQEGGVWLHPVDDVTHGHWLPDGPHFGLDAELQPDGSLLVAWCVNQGESAGSLQTTTWSLEQLENLPPIVVYPMIAPFTRKLYLAPIKDLSGVSGSNSEVVIDGALQAANRPCWVGQDLNGGWTSVDRAYDLGRLLGIAAESRGDLSGYAHVRAKANAMKTRVAWWKDGPDQLAAPTDLHEWDQIWAEWYVFKEHGETLPTALDRWKREFDLALKSKCHDLGGIPQYRTRAVFSDQEIVNIIATAIEFFRNADPRLSIFAPFEYDSINGITGNAAVWEMYLRTRNSVPVGVPTLVQAWPVPPPPITRNSFVLFA